MGGVSVDLIHSAVWEWIDRLQILNPLETMYKVLNIFEKTRELEEEKRELEKDK